MATEHVYTARAGRPPDGYVCGCCGVADAEFWFVVDGESLPLCDTCLVENCDLEGIELGPWAIEPERVERIRAEVLPTGQMSGRWVAPPKEAVDG